MLAQIRATQGSYALSPLFVEPQHIKMKPKVGRASLLLSVLGHSALAEGGDGWNRAYATTGRTGSRRLSSRPAPSSFDSLFVSRRRTLQSIVPPLQGDRVQTQLHMRATGGHRLHPRTGVEGDHMRIKNIIPEACHICGQQTSLAAIEPHPTHPEMELHTFRCDDCGPVRTVSQRKGKLPRAA